MSSDSNSDSVGKGKHILFTCDCDCDSSCDTGCACECLAGHHQRADCLSTPGSSTEGISKPDNFGPPLTDNTENPQINDILLPEVRRG